MYVYVYIYILHIYDVTCIYILSWYFSPSTFKGNFFILPLNRAVCVRIVHLHDPSANHGAGMNLQNWAIKIWGFWSFLGIKIQRYSKNHVAQGMPPTWPKRFGHLGAWQRVSAGYCRWPQLIWSWRSLRIHGKRWRDKVDFQTFIRFSSGCMISFLWFMDFHLNECMDFIMNLLISSIHFVIDSI